jgi:hypothetical protein
MSFTNCFFNVTVSELTSVNLLFMVRTKTKNFTFLMKEKIAKLEVPFAQAQNSKTVTRYTKKEKPEMCLNIAMKILLFVEVTRSFSVR